jgi:ribulose-phosphate 3-epimerase
MPVAKISPSMLSCDFANLAAEAKRMTKNGADWLHLGKCGLKGFLDKFG